MDFFGCTGGSYRTSDGPRSLKRAILLKAQMAQSSLGG